MPELRWELPTTRCTQKPCGKSSHLGSWGRPHAQHFSLQNLSGCPIQHGEIPKSLQIPWQGGRWEYSSTSISRPHIGMDLWNPRHQPVHWNKNLISFRVIICFMTKHDLTYFPVVLMAQQWCSSMMLWKLRSPLPLNGCMLDQMALDYWISVKCRQVLKQQWSILYPRLYLLPSCSPFQSSHCSC